jgi:hypothetical protein
MREEEDVTKRMDRYRKELLDAVNEKERLGRHCGGELDLRILSLIHKLEVLFWVLEIDLPKNKMNILH